MLNLFPCIPNNIRTRKSSNKSKRIQLSHIRHHDTPPVSFSPTPRDRFRRAVPKEPPLEMVAPFAPFAYIFQALVTSIGGCNDKNKVLHTTQFFFFFEVVSFGVLRFSHSSLFCRDSVIRGPYKVRMAKPHFVAL